MYEYTDKVLKILRKKIYSEFHKVLLTDELNVIPNYYFGLSSMAFKALLDIAKHYYPQANAAWLRRILNDYNHITQYVFNHEIKRKENYMIEALMSGANKKKVIDKAMQRWYNMVRQYADIVTDKAVMDKYLSEDIEYVVWMARKDKKCCKACRNRDGKMYHILKAPPKEHWNCRCTYLPV